MQTIKVLAVTGFVGAAIFFVLNYYLPSVTGEASVRSAAGDRRVVSTNVETARDDAKKDGPAGKEENSVADELGVPRPATVSYAAFSPENIKREPKKVREIFTVPAAIKTEVDFWKAAYTRYDKTKVIFHDRKYLDIVYSEIDVGKIVNDEKLSDDEKAKRKSEIVDAEAGRIEKILKELAKKPPDKLGKEEKVIFALFEKISEPDKFTEAAARVRSQTGIRDKFIVGIRVSGKYLGEMEKIFAAYGIPLEITRLAFVESMFSLNALSRSGASGVWQFMPGTGRLFLTINKHVDERNDPIAATDAAARHLLRDYGRLGSWPLAINAYNAGPAAVASAATKMKTNDIAVIIKGYDAGNYGFASRNFYPAFLAALDAFENREKYFGKIEMDPPLSLDRIAIPAQTTFPDLVRSTGIPTEELVILNPELQEGVVSGKLPLPREFYVNVPTGAGEKSLAALAATMMPAK